MSTARIAALYLRPSSRTPVKRVGAAEAVAGAGLRGDHAGGGNRQLTLIDAAAWAAACTEIGVDLDPGARRANVVVEGLRLADTIGRRLHVGATVVDVVGELTPCRLMDDAAPGLMLALRPDRRGGIYGRIVEGGPLAVGDPVRLADAD